MLIALASLVGCYTPPDLPLVDDVPIEAVGDRCAPPREEHVACSQDGDTFDVKACGSSGERVRLLGIDAPEIAHGSDPADCWGPEAQEELARLLVGREVVLSFDEEGFYTVSDECTGIFGRTLAYVWLSDEDAIDLADHDPEEGPFLVNEYLLREGFARIYDEDLAEEALAQERLEAAQDEAQARGRGLWGACGGDPG